MAQNTPNTSSADIQQQASQQQMQQRIQFVILLDCTANMFLHSKQVITKLKEIVTHVHFQISLSLFPNKSFAFITGEKKKSPHVHAKSCCWSNNQV